MNLRRKVEKFKETCFLLKKRKVEGNRLVLLLKPTNIHFSHFPSVFVSATELQAESSRRQNTAWRHKTHTHTHSMNTQTHHTHMLNISLTQHPEETWLPLNSTQSEHIMPQTRYNSTHTHFVAYAWQTHMFLLGDTNTKTLGKLTWPRPTELKRFMTWWHEDACNHGNGPNSASSGGKYCKCPLHLSCFLSLCVASVSFLLHVKQKKFKCAMMKSYFRVSTLLWCFIALC